MEELFTSDSYPLTHFLKTLLEHIIERTNMLQCSVYTPTLFLELLEE